MANKNVLLKDNNDILYPATLWENIFGMISDNNDLSLALASKQSQLSAAQLAAADSGVTAQKVNTYDGYSTSKQNSLSSTQLAAVDSGINSTKVTAYESLVSTAMRETENYVANANLFITAGCAKTNTSTTNLPLNDYVQDRWGSLLYLPENDADGTGYQFWCCIAYAGSTHRGEVYTRTIISGTPTAWKKILTVGDASLVSVSSTGTATEEVNYITIDGTEKKLAGGSNVSVSSTGTSTNEVKYITIDGTENKLAGGNSVSVSSTGTATEEVKYIVIDGVEKKFLTSGGDSLSFDESDSSLIKVDDGTNIAIEANPTLSGTEQPLTGLKVGSTKYSVSSGGAQKYLHKVLLDSHSSQGSPAALYWVDIVNESSSDLTIDDVIGTFSELGTNKMPVIGIIQMTYYEGSLTKRMPAYVQIIDGVTKLVCAEIDAMASGNAQIQCDYSFWITVLDTSIIAQQTIAL